MTITMDDETLMRTLLSAAEAAADTGNIALHALLTIAAERIKELTK